ncbi:U-box domain-containing protein 28 [Nymphaea thermarum]|nr:U-box domain-containing protein 28 [Nymphaea thermarum]
MRKDDLCITVPSFFKCPISLDVMKSPVSLCTGVTYDRSSIQRWLDSGNNTCPATMQVLQTKEVVPNHTLHRLIQMWSETSSTKRHLHPNSPLDHRKQHADSVQPPDDLPKVIIGVRDGAIDSVKRVAQIVQSSEQCRDAVATAGGVDAISGVLRVEKGMAVLQEAVKALGPILAVRSDSATAEMLTTPEAVRSFAAVLAEGNDPEAVAECARAIESLATANSDSSSAISASDPIVAGLVKVITADSPAGAREVEAAVSCMAAIAALRRARTRVVRLGTVPAIVRFLQRPDSGAAALEKAMKVLELASTCAEGRAAICESPECVTSIVGKLMKAGGPATESGVVVLWSVCHAFRDRRAAEAVVKSNGPAKILLLMQSNCSPGVRQMAGDLLKTFRADYKNCLSRYESKATHIMPF